MKYSNFLNRNMKKSVLPDSPVEAALGLVSLVPVGDLK
jgi:hypothetical protein